MTHRIFLFLLTGIVSFSAQAVFAQAAKSPEIVADDLLTHVKYLASDKLEGRRPGNAGNQLAAEYIASEFEAFGLQPKGEGNTFFQPFELIVGVKLGSKNAFHYTHESQKSKELEISKSFRPFGFSTSGSYSGEVAFVGYGVIAPEKKFDEYAGVAVKDKAVLMLRMAPPIDSNRAVLDRLSGLRFKIAKAKELGARAVIIVTGPADSDSDDLMKLTYDQSGDAGIIVVSMTRKAADDLLSPMGETIKSLQEAINTTLTPQSRLIADLRVSIQTDLSFIRATSSNVIGYLEGSDPELKKEVLVIGAHYDHLGWGGEGSMKPDTHAIHYGADDNASGTAGVLELAQTFAAKRTHLKRSILFIAFTAEEMGLLGSAHYVKTPAIPLEQTITMMNMDMIGRLTDRKLIVYGTGTSPGFDSLVRAHDKDSAFVLKLVKDGMGPSDHASFYSKKIPVFQFFTDLHSDYHRPYDTYDRLNYPGMEQIVKFVYGIANDLAQVPSRPQYAAVEVARPAGGMGRSGRVWVGTVPDFGEQAEGMKISGVSEGSPAQKAGLKGGDVIVKFGRIDIKNLYDFTYAIGEYRAGDQVDVVVKRGNETLTFPLTVGKRPN